MFDNLKKKQSADKTADKEYNHLSQISLYNICIINCLWPMMEDSFQLIIRTFLLD